MLISQCAHEPFQVAEYYSEINMNLEHEIFSHLLKNKLLSFQKAKLMEPFHILFYLPLLEEAFAQLGLLQNLLENQNVNIYKD